MSNLFFWFVYFTLDNIYTSSRAPWSCGLIHYLLDWEVGGSNPTTAHFFRGEGGEARVDDTINKSLIVILQFRILRGTILKE